LNNSNKQQFKEMLDTLFDIHNRKHADQNLLRVWWHKLESYPIDVISQSFDFWTSNSNKSPTPYDIILICRSKNQQLLASSQKQIKAKPMSEEKRKEMKVKIRSLIGKMTGRSA